MSRIPSPIAIYGRRGDYRKKSTWEKKIRPRMKNRECGRDAEREKKI